MISCEIKRRAKVTKASSRPSKRDVHWASTKDGDESGIVVLDLEERKEYVKEARMSELFLLGTRSTHPVPSLSHRSGTSARGREVQHQQYIC